MSHLERFNASLASLKSTQTEAFTVLPQPKIYTEDPKYQVFHSLDDLGINADASLEVPVYTLLRCAIEGLAAKEKKAGTEELFAVLETRYAWLRSEPGLEYQVIGILFILHIEWHSDLYLECIVGNSQQQSVVRTDRRRQSLSLGT